VPQINTVETYTQDISADYETTRSYVRHRCETMHEWKSTLKYVADAEDEEWLENNVKFGGKQDDGPSLSLDQLERILDLLEKETGFNAIITSHQAESTVLMKLPDIVVSFQRGTSSSVSFKQVLHDTYSYWVAKRSKLKRPLLRRFWPVTSSDDTNPHLVFRPFDKEKYRLRKKRQNDLEAFQKMKQLRSDFDSLRAVLDLVKKREELQLLQVKLQVDRFYQHLYDCIDSSGKPRVSRSIHIEEARESLHVPVLFDIQTGRRKRATMDRSKNGSSQSLVDSRSHKRSRTESMVDTKFSNIAGQNQGEPAPSFLDPLATRSSCSTNYLNRFPPIESAQVRSVYFKHRPRVGRGGRVCIDRIPIPRSQIAPITFLRAGLPMQSSKSNTHNLLDLLPQPLDRVLVKRRIEALCVAALSEDHDAKSTPVGVDSGNDGDEIIVRAEDWLETDDQIWGEERSSLDP